jgi:voltage-gated potassium channel Kch
VGVERDPDAPYVALAQRLGVPVVIADGTDRRALERLGLARSRGVAAVASDELANIAVAVTAAAIDPTVAVTLRAGEQEALVETRSLLRLGATRDVTALACAFVVAHVWGLRPESATVTSAGTWVRLDDGSFTRLAPSRHDDCRHEIADPALPATAPANVAG